MILLRKFLTFPHVQSFRRLTYGKYEFEIYTRGEGLAVSHGETWKNYTNYINRILTTLRVGPRMIIMRQTCFNLMTLDYTEYYFVNLCREVSGMSYKKFIDVYARALPACY